MKSTKKRRKAFEDSIGKGVAGVDADADTDADTDADAGARGSSRRSRSGVCLVQGGPAEGEVVDLPTTAPERRRSSQIIDSSARGLL
ncbi:uncharacterized protein FFB20_04344 [Fusarium fujikuroi]|uniref:Uncharacterized protein n=2 Tax=Fusarium fujikuroi TaxID=5127 RepID=S0DQ31_GIBF5|nr:uncharacterized protein FFUJ_00740 [Fusarium fujikuroi IMI 58289]KLP03060.1 uncharacterized protein Y057_9863 [Fusarium fujikuroi]KLP13697.1 uncharacterized protein LW94_5704 [Fusarium fujikuroi]CCT62683.1 uncharacterized protein FFUJ_00740 [Fusarium fujikuroi IMI 58289]SCN67044.1 uncharacterized protein FFE2_00808 [Fusarium fujikuroi]SCN70158.1 uncharacterized protein FFC1_00804 [Fusarium fujikuroi]